MSGNSGRNVFKPPCLSCISAPFVSSQGFLSTLVFWQGLHFIFWVHAFVCLFYMQLYYRFYGLGAGRGVLSLCLDCHLQTCLMCCPILFANILFRIFHQYSYMRLVCSFILSCLSGLKINVRLVSQEEFRSLPSSSLLPRNKRTQK